MLCDNCGEREATFHYTKIVNGKKSEKHLCQVCANELGETSVLEPKFSLQNLLSGFLQPGRSKRQRVSQARCEMCGLTYSEFAKRGQLGCAQCYDRFADELAPLIERIQGNAEHKGKISCQAGEETRRQRRLRELRRELDRAVQEERYERAAEIRDEIQELERGN